MRCGPAARSWSTKRWPAAAAKGPAGLDGRLPPSRHIEGKGRAKGYTTITVTRNDLLYGLNRSDKFILAIVMVDGEQHQGPFYVRQPFSQEPDWAVTSINLDLDALLARATPLGGAS
jgi:hypothetical protein